MQLAICTTESRQHLVKRLLTSLKVRPNDFTKVVVVMRGKKDPSIWDSLSLPCEVLIADSEYRDQLLNQIKELSQAPKDAIDFGLQEKAEGPLSTGLQRNWVTLLTHGHCVAICDDDLVGPISLFSPPGSPQAKVGRLKYSEIDEVECTDSMVKPIEVPLASLDDCKDLLKAISLADLLEFQNWFALSKDQNAQVWAGFIGDSGNQVQVPLVMYPPNAWNHMSDEQIKAALHTRTVLRAGPSLLEAPMVAVQFSFSMLSKEFSWPPFFPYFRSQTGGFYQISKLLYPDLRVLLTPFVLKHLPEPTRSQDLAEIIGSLRRIGTDRLIHLALGGLAPGVSFGDIAKALKGVASSGHQFFRQAQLELQSQNQDLAGVLEKRFQGHSRPILKELVLQAAQELRKEYSFVSDILPYDYLAGRADAPGVMLDEWSDKFDSFARLVAHWPDILAASVRLKIGDSQI